jgi:hypothetical protein
MMEQSVFKNSLVVSAIIIVVGMLAAVGLFTHNMSEQGKSVSVSGTAKQTVTSDSAVWKIPLTYTANGQDEFKAGSDSLQKSMNGLRDALVQGGIDASAISMSSITTAENYGGGGNVGSANNTKTDFTGTITVRSNEVQKVSDASKNIASFISKASQKSLTISPGNPEYVLTNISTLRQKILAEAVKDAQENAKALLATSGSRIGALTSISQSYVSVVAPGTASVADGGYGSSDSYGDISTIEKEVIANVSLSFEIN